MRLLSNLYKQRFITNESESRVINSNTLAYRILEEQSRALAKTREPEQPQAESGGFVEGIAAPQVETIDYEAEAKEKAEEILAQANAEADEIRKAAREEADEIRKQAQEQGQAEGLEQGMQEGAAVYDAKLESIGKREQQLQDSYLEQMRENLAARMKAALEQVNVKATTEEKLGFTGDGSGMAAHAVVLREKVK